MGRTRAKKGYGAAHDLVSTSVGIPRGLKQLADREQLNLSEFVRERLRLRYSKTAAERIAELNEQVQLELRAQAEEQVRAKLISDLTTAIQYAAYDEWKHLGLNPTFDAERASFKHYVTVLCHLTDGVPGKYLDECLMLVEREKQPTWDAMAAERAKIPHPSTGNTGGGA